MATHQITAEVVAYAKSHSISLSPKTVAILSTMPAKEQMQWVSAPKVASIIHACDQETLARVRRALGITRLQPPRPPSPAPAPNVSSSEEEWGGGGCANGGSLCGASDCEW